MFTGITQSTSKIITVDSTTAVLRVHIERHSHLTLMVGDSILLNGICSTLVSCSDEEYSVEYMAETRRCTTVNEWNVGDTINTELSLTLQTPLSGWLVTGHVDVVGVVDDFQSSPNQTKITISFPEMFSHLITEKGSITINGVNLTSVEVQNTTCSVYIIPHTLTHTNLNLLSIGSRVNLEFDYFAKLTERYLKRP